MAINISLLDTWSFSWAKEEQTTIDEVKKLLSITDEQILNIQKWSKVCFEKNQIGWPNTFSSLDTIIEYKDRFFEHINNYEVISVYFSKNQKNYLLAEIASEENENEGDVGIKINRQNKIIEISTKEIEVGFDLICMEFGGSFYSFHQYDVTEKLVDNFGININDYGLIENVSSWEEILNYVSKEVGDYFPYNWHYAKVKKHHKKAPVSNNT